MKSSADRERPRRLLDPDAWRDFGSLENGLIRRLDRVPLGRTGLAGATGT